MASRKSIAMLIALGLVLGSQAARASTLGIPDNQRLTADLKPRFEVNAAILGLQPSASNLNYVIYNKALPTETPGWNELELRPSYAFAFEVGARWLSENQDLSLDWTHLNSTTSSSVVAPNANFFLGPDFDIGPDALPIHNATGKATFKYDVINLEAGQSLDLGQHLGLRIFGGLSNGYLREQVVSMYSGTLVTGAFLGPFSTQQTVTANFAGIGPRFGAQMDYHLSGGFGILGEAAASALIGNAYSRTAYISSAPELLALYGKQYNYQTIKNQNIIQVIPGLDAKLGITYDTVVKNNMTLHIEGGYQAAVYVNAINQYLPGTLVAGESLTVGGIFVATMNHTQSNYSVHGVFLKGALGFA